MTAPDRRADTTSPWAGLHDAPLVTDRLRLRPLTPDDVGPHYLAWFADPDVRRHIDYAAAEPDVDDLHRYVAEREDRPDVLFLGIFARDDGTHLGNVKFEPVDHRAGRATMGIMLGEPSWRGRGVTGEVLAATTDYLATEHGIREIDLGVAVDNTAAIRAYEKAGFVHAGDEAAPGVLRMVWRAAS